jgi:hypothetical protein
MATSWNRETVRRERMGGRMASRKRRRGRGKVNRRAKNRVLGKVTC